MTRATTVYTPILSVDLGRTSTKTTNVRDPEQVQLIPANFIELPLDQIRGGVFESRATNPLGDLWLEYQGKGYAVGQLAADFGADLGVGKSKVEGALVKTLIAAGFFDLDADVVVVLSLPYHSHDQFEKEKEESINQLLGPHTYNYRGTERAVNITKVWVMPEGYGSLLWTEAQAIKKSDKDRDLTSTAVAVVDIGHQTTDFLIVDNFRFGRAASKSEDFGMSRFYDLVADEVDGADSQSISFISAVNKPEGARFYRPRGAAKPFDLDKVLPSQIAAFSREITRRIIVWLPERVTDVIITGGGGEFFADDIQRILRDAQVNAHLAIPSRKANALGQFVYGETQIAKAKA